MPSSKFLVKQRYSRQSPFNYILFQAVVHVSTAFIYFDEEEIKEDVYHDSKINPDKLVEFLDELNDDEIKDMTKQ